MEPPEGDLLASAYPPPSFPKFKKYSEAVYECLDRKEETIEE